MLRKLWALLKTPLGELFRRKVEEKAGKVVSAVLVEAVQMALAPAASCSTIAKHVPQPGTAVVEVYSAAGLVAMDTVKAAPGTPVDDIVYTNVVVPNGPKEFRHIEFDVKAGQDFPFPLPDHLVKQEATHLKVWWSQEAQ